MASKELMETVAGYEKYVKIRGFTEEIVCEYYLPAVKRALKEEKDPKFGLPISYKTKRMICALIKKACGASVYDLEVYCQKNNNLRVKLLDAYYDVLDAESPYLFDSYMLALEKNRRIKDRFYAPKREQFIKHGIIQALQDLEDDKLDIVTISLPPGTGKCLEIHEKVLTPAGFKQMKDIHVGDKVITPDGEVADVTVESPVHDKELYKIVFNDKSNVICSYDHLWKVKTENGEYKLLETQDMLNDYSHMKYSIPNVRNINFKEKKLPMKPYELGVAIANGTESFEGEYLYGSYEQRLELLKGIMDTIGKAFMDCVIKVPVQKREWMEKLIELARSLGIYTTYLCDISHCLYFVYLMVSENDPCVFKNNAENIDGCRPAVKEVERTIRKIIPMGVGQCKCIYVNHPDHLFITNDYIVTHNTTLEKFFITWVIGKRPEYYSLFFSHSDDITKMFYEGVLDITTDKEYRFKELFPKTKLVSKDAKRQQIDFGKKKAFASLQCSSIGSKNAGKVRTNAYLCCDDLIGKLEEALNRRMLNKIWESYATDLRQRKEDGCKELVIATRWSNHDVIGRIEEIYAGDKRVKTIAIPDIDPETGESNFQYKIKGISTKFFEDQALLMDDVTYNCLYKQKPIEREGQLYAVEDLRRYEELPDREPDAIIGICDVKEKGSDFMFLPCFYQYDDDYYMEDCVCDNSSDYDRQYSRLSGIILENNMQNVTFESNAGGSRCAYEVRRRVEEAGGRCNIDTKPTETNKETRIQMASDWVKKHIVFKASSKYTKKSDYGVAMTWLCSYTSSGRNEHDDVPDGLSIFYNKVTGKAERRKTKIYRNVM